MTLSRTHAARSAARMVILYTIISAVWIAVSDRAVNWLVLDPATRLSLETTKGWLFVVVTAALFYWALRAEFARTARASAAGERYQLLSENARDIMLFVRERDGRILEANPAAVEAYGYGRDDLLQKTIYDLRTGVPAERVHAQLEEAVRSGVLFEGEHRRSDGSSFPVEVSSKGVRVGNDNMLVSVIREISERKAAEEKERHLAADRDRLLARLNLILNHMPIACILTDADERVTYWNPAAERVFGFTGEEMLGRTQFGANIPAAAEAAVRNIFRRMAAGERVAPLVHENVTKDGRTIVCEWHNVALTEPDGARVGFLAMAIDMTERLRAEEEIRQLNTDLEQRVELRTAELRAANDRLQQATDELRRLNQLKSEFVSNVSHELRTPLTNIKLYLSLLQDGRPEKRELYLKTLEHETALLQSLIEDLLDLSRLDLGTAHINLTPVNLNDLLQALTQDRQMLLQARGLTLRVDLPESGPTVSADPRLLSQVFSNVLTNAMNYTTAPGTIAVSLRVCPGADGGTWAVCAVADSGPGITEEDLPHLFERFYRGAAASASHAPGTGLGLAICEEIIQRHGGHIAVESRVGQGSTFSMWLPVA